MALRRYMKVSLFKAKNEHLLEVAKRAVEVVIEQDEAVGMAYLAREGALT